MMTKKMSNEVTSMTDKKLIQPTDGTVEQTLNRSFGAIEDEDCCSLRHIYWLRRNKQTCTESENTRRNADKIECL